jgi:hypothetical protein
MQLLETPPVQREDRAGALAARARGRERWLRGSLEAVERSPLPGMPSGVEVLALLTRSRTLRIALGELHPEHLYDLRTFKTCWAELGYLYRLAGDGKRYGGTVVTSMRQLVTGLAPLHPTWKLTGDEWEDRDRHHRSVRRRLVALAEAGLLEWTWRMDDDLERRATILRLLEVPQLTADELAAAAARLEHWEGAYDPDLNSGSPIEIRNVRRAAAPLSAPERQRRGCLQARKKAEAKRSRAASQIISHPPSGALSKTTEKSLVEAPTSNAHEIRNVCGLKTRVTRSDSSPDFSVCAAISAAETAASRENPRGGGGPGFTDDSALLERIRARREALEPVLDLKAAQLTQRAGEVVLWSTGRAFPIGRIREAWVVWCLGERQAANWGAFLAGALDVDDPERLGRAARRYERHVAARPVGWPELGLAALAQIAGEDAERRSEPSLHRSIRALDQLSKRMRAIDTMRDRERRDRQAERAAGRHTAAAVEAPVGRLVFRRAPGRVWPWWVQLDPSGQPVLQPHGELVVVEDRIRVAPGRGDREHIETLRDARLLAGLWAQQDGDGRYAMATRNQPSLGTAGGRAALPGPYAAPPGRLPGPRRRVDPRLLELAHLTGLKLWQVTQMYAGPGHCDEDLDNALKLARAERRREDES